MSTNKRFSGLSTDDNHHFENCWIVSSLFSLFLSSRQGLFIKILRLFRKDFVEEKGKKFVSMKRENIFVNETA
jgi:hypothetical protein